MRQKIFLGSRTLRVAKSMWQRPCCYTSLGVQTNLAIIIYFHLIEFDLLDYVQRTVLMRQEGAIQQVHTQFDEREGSSKSCFGSMLVLWCIICWNFILPPFKYHVFVRNGFFLQRDWCLSPWNIIFANGSYPKGF